MEKTMAYSSSVNKNGVFAVALRSALIGFVVSLILTLVFAFIVKLTGLNNNMIGIVNQVNKILSVFFGVLFGLRDRSKWFFKGALGGMIFSLLTFFVFGLLGAGFKGINLLIDLLIGLLVGVLGALFSSSRK